MVLESPSPDAKLTVRRPDKELVEARLGKAGQSVFTDTDLLGAYEVISEGKTIHRFAVNLFDDRESDIRPKSDPEIEIGYVRVHGQWEWEATRRELWKLLLLLGLAVLLFEWYIYNRRVYM